MKDIQVMIEIKNIDKITQLAEQAIKEAEQLSETVAQLNEIKLDIETRLVTD